MKIKHRLLLTGILLTISQTLLSQEKLQIQTNTSMDTIPFELTSHNNISIKAVFGNVDTLNLMFHTAANSINLTTRATKKMKSIHWDAKSDVGSWGGKTESRFSENNSIKIGKLQWDSVPVWEDENSGPTTDGKFGPDLFEGYIIEVDFDENLLILHKSLPKKADKYFKLHMIFENDALFINGTSSLDGVYYKNNFLIHSGYGGALLFDDKFAADSKIGERIEIIEQKELKDSFGNLIKIKKGLLPKFTIGNVELTNVPVGFFEGKIGQQHMSIIGADVLKRFNIIFDLNREFIYLKTNQLQKMAYTQF